LESGDEDDAPMLTLLKELVAGQCGDVPVITGRLKQLMLRGCITQIENFEPWDVANLPSNRAALFDNFLPFKKESLIPLSGADELTLEQQSDTQQLLNQLRHTDNLYEQVEILEALLRLEHMAFDTGLGHGQVVTVEVLLEEVYDKAIAYRKWGIMRWVAGLNKKVVPLSLADAVTDILARRKQISVGRAYSADSLINTPLSPQEILTKINTFCREDVRDRILTQEMLIYLSLLLKAKPKLFDGLLTIRVGYLILLLTSEIAKELNVPQDEAYERLMDYSPDEIQTLLHFVMQGYEKMNQTLMAQESLSSAKASAEIDWAVEPAQDESEQEADWRRRRERDGAVNRVPEGFYPNVWDILRHCRGLVIGDKLERRNRLDSEPLISEMTAGETNFALKVEHLLNKISSPLYRQINIECLVELGAIVQKNPDLHIHDYIVLDVLIGHAVRLFWLQNHPEHEHHYDDHKADAWHEFYGRSPFNCARHILGALKFLTQLEPAGQ
ncbi:MAG: glycoside hydrolase family 15 protein, partial [Cyanobacteria bacterium P01_F01_bin.42]